MLQILDKSRWPELTDVFKKEFDSSLPHDTATILAEIDDAGEIGGFVVMEYLGRIGQIYNGGKDSRAMFNFFDKEIPPGNSVIAIASDARFEGLCEKFGMLRVEGVVYRKDF